MYTITLEFEVATFLKTRGNATSSHTPPPTKTPLVADALRRAKLARHRGEHLAPTFQGQSTDQITSMA